MEYLAVTSIAHPETLRVTVLGALVICLVLLALYHVLVAKKQFAPAPAAPAAPPKAAGLETSSFALRHSMSDHTGANQSKYASFQNGPEPPVFWGSSGGSDLDDYQHGAEGHSMKVLKLDDAAQAEYNAAHFYGRGGKAGYTDAHLSSTSLKGL